LMRTDKALAREGEPALWEVLKHRGFKSRVRRHRFDHSRHTQAGVGSVWSSINQQHASDE
jgi:hypothetical protein